MRVRVRVRVSVRVRVRVRVSVRVWVRVRVPPHPQSPSSENWTEHGKKRVMTRYPTLRPPRYATVPPRLFFFLNSLSRRFQNRKAVPNAARAFSTPSFSRYSSFFFLRKRCFDATWTHLPQGFNANLNLNSVPRKLNLPQLYQ